MFFSAIKKDEYKSFVFKSEKMGCNCCYDSKKEMKRVKKLAKLWENNTGEKTVLVKKIVGEKVYWDFEVVITNENEL